jgi:hypothetical protein
MQNRFKNTHLTQNSFKQLMKLVERARLRGTRKLVSSFLYIATLWAGGPIDPLSMVEFQQYGHKF